MRDVPVLAPFCDTIPVTFPGPPALENPTFSPLWGRFCHTPGERKRSQNARQTRYETSHRMPVRALRNGSQNAAKTVTKRSQNGRPIRYEMPRPRHDDPRLFPVTKPTLADGPMLNPRKLATPSHPRYHLSMRPHQGACCVYHISRILNTQTLVADRLQG